MEGYFEWCVEGCFERFVYVFLLRCVEGYFERYVELI